MHRLKNGVIHLGLIVVLLVVLTAAASVAISAQYSPVGRLFSAPSPCSPYGDVNGDSRVSVSDANIILRYSQGRAQITKPERADVNKDGRVDSIDASLVRQYLSRRIGTFPVCVSVGIKPSPSPRFQARGPCYPRGDINNDGVINKTDSDRIVEHSAGKFIIAANMTSRADLNLDGKINNTDSQLILQYMASGLSTWPACN